MRLRIAHSIVHRYEPPAASVIQVLRLTPRNYEGQYIINWRIDVSGDTRLNAHEDAFGNLTHVFAADGPFAELSINVEGEAETQNADGIVRGTLERFPPSLFLRDTALTQADDAIRDFALDVRATNAGDTLAELHALLNRLHEEFIREPDAARAPTTTAVEAFMHKRGDARDLTHIFLGAARSLRIPARFRCRLPLWPRRAGRRRPRLGRGPCAAAGLGRLRHRPLPLPNRILCAGRHRPRRARRRAGARHPLWHRRRARVDRHTGRSMI